VAKEHYPDPTAEKGDWSVVDLKPVKRLKKPVSLTAIKAHPDLQNMALVRISRLSVSPVSEAEFNIILVMGDTSL
jgi:predicted RNA-binding protein with PUA-like domain